MSFTKNSPQSGDQIQSAHIRDIEDWLYPINYVTLTNGNTITGVVSFIAGQNICLTGTATGGVTVSITGSLGVTALSGLTDTNVTGSSNGDLLIRLGGVWTSTPSGNVGTKALSGLVTDTNVTGAADGQVLVRRGGMWTSVPTGSIATSTPIQATPTSFPAIYSNAYVGLIDEFMVMANITTTGFRTQFTTAPSGGNVGITIYKNGVSITTQTLTAGNTYVSTANATAFTYGDIIKFEI